MAITSPSATLDPFFVNCSVEPFASSLVFLISITGFSAVPESITKLGVVTVTAVEAFKSIVGAVASSVVPALISKWPSPDAKISSPPPTS